MAAKKRRAHPTVKQTLFEDVCSFNFFKAVHLLEGGGRGTALGKALSPSKDPVRFRVKPGFTFPASDMLAIQNGHVDRSPVVTVNFMGLVGPKGVLPDWYNAHALEQNHKKDYAITDFLDLFHHRLVSLFYMAWKKYRLAENYRPNNSDPISMGLSSLVGMGENEQKAVPEFDRSARRRLIYFAGMASRIVPTASTVEAVITNATGVTARIKQFVERMIPIDVQEKTCLGRANGTLKKDALCGGRIRDVVSCFIVELGPMSWRKYLAYQSRSRNLELVRKLIRFLVGLEYDFEIRLILEGPKIPNLELGGGKRGAPVLGRTVLLKRPTRRYWKDVVVKTTTAKEYGS
jgi:type VI secretion system protein ImpH